MNQRHSRRKFFRFMCWLRPLLSLWLVVNTLGFSLQAEPLLVRYPKPETAFDRRTDYPLELLKLALEKSKTPYQLIPSVGEMPQGRALTQLANGIDVDVVWSMTSDEREAQLQPIRIPIYKGLIGWRLFLIHEQTLTALPKSMTIQQLREMTMIQGHDWPDTDILRSNGMNVIGASNYKSIFNMLAKHRIDLFPRSIVEIWSEADSHAGKGIVVEPDYLLVYPTAFYYFVAPDNIALALTIERGLNTAIDDGSFDTLFVAKHRELIEMANLPARQRFQLNNPLLPEATPVTDERLWFELNEGVVGHDSQR